MNDLTFILNEPNKKLKDRFNELIKDCKYFDCLVAYFYLSGFKTIYKSLESAERIRIIIGIGMGKDERELIKNAFQEKNNNFLSYSETLESIEGNIKEELENCDDNEETEEGIRKFIEWLKIGKIQIRVFSKSKIHAKLYIITFKEGDRDIGRVITGSSNFSKSGLEENLEFNVELRNPSDYYFAKNKFEELWNDSNDISEEFITMINEKTWLNSDITPYELYLKFLYEYFKEELDRDDEFNLKFLPKNFKKLHYQEQAVLNAIKIIKEHGGVFLSDVVGLGKTYIAAMVASQLDGRTLILAPPSLLNVNNPGSWRNVVSDFGIPADLESIGKLDNAIRLTKQREYKNIIIDESHRFKNEQTVNYEKLVQITRGKRVILVSATPYNNSPNDILAQIKLFQNPRNSTIPGIKDLEKFFRKLENRLKKVDRKKDYDKYIEITRQNAKEIRDKVIKYLMVRRTRSEIEQYFYHDLIENKISFPELQDPICIYYKFNELEDQIFMESINLITNGLRYARYTPLLYLKDSISKSQEMSQKNMGGFMKVLLVKRLESSFHAFKKTIDRFIYSYELFLKEYKKGQVYISKTYSNKIFQLLEQDDIEEIHKLIEEGKAERYPSDAFRKDFIFDLERDYKILKKIREKWSILTRDPKLDSLIENLQNNEILKKNKVVIFTESKETSEYLYKQLTAKIKKGIILFHGNSSESIRSKVIENFDANATEKKDDFQILISTEVLSEGVNLHRSNVIINYDIPWNPIRLIQRIGRLNRINTPFDKIYIFNFFPTKQADSEIELTKIAQQKIEAFLNLLGDDASILTEGEPVASHELFDKLTTKSIFLEEQDEETELKYLKFIERIRKEQPELFEKIKRLPKKARSAKIIPEDSNNKISNPSLLTFFRKGKLNKFYLSNENNTLELDFISAVKIFECSAKEGKLNINLKKYYQLLEKNKNSFFEDTLEDIDQRKGRDSEYKLLKIVKAIEKDAKGLTEKEEEFLSKLKDQLIHGGLPKKTIQRVLKEISSFEGSDLLKIYNTLKSEIPDNLLKSYVVKGIEDKENEREIILSLYLAN